ncbi:MAG: AI-2E family transporter [Saprospiraceae bacterium]|nr:AI-2E family transporter [Saprospiraceae bacterium]
MTIQTKNIGQRVALGASLLVAAWLIYVFNQIVFYTVAAWVVSLLGKPLMKFFDQRLRFGKWKAGPGLSAMLTMASFFLIFLLLFLLFVPMLIRQTGNLADVDYAKIAVALNEPFQNVLKWLEGKGLHPPQQSLESILTETFQDYFNPGIIGSFFSGLITAAGNIAIGLFAVVFIAFFFLKEENLLVGFIAALLPARYENQVRNAVDETSRMLGRYFSAIALQISAIAIYVSFWLSVLGVQNAILIALFAALMNVIPYIGPLIGGIVGIGLTLTSSLDLEFYTQMLPLLGKVLLVFWTVQLIDNYLIQPYLFSASVMAHPLEIFIVTLMGAQLGGITGMVLAIPGYTVLRVIAREFLSRYRIVQKMTDRMDEGHDGDDVIEATN